MNLKNLLLVILTFTFITSVNAQKIQLKKGILLVDGIEVLSYKKTKRYNEYYYYTLNTTDEVIFIKLCDNGTDEYSGDDYKKIYFSQFNILIETKTLSYGANSKPIIEKLMQEGVLTLEGKIIEEKLKIFYTKYHDYVSSNSNNSQ